ncbi:MAG: nucleotidyltransferase domain-containing protein [Acidimicrobiales bacterium]
MKLGRRAGVTQSVVSAYESGSRKPALPMLERLVQAAGFELDIQLRQRHLGGTTFGGTLAERLRCHGQEVRLIAGRYGLSNLRIFGSVARGDEGADSDVDLLVSVAPGVSLMSLARCQRDLEALLGARVDLIPVDDLKDGVREAALADARAI